MNKAVVMTVCQRPFYLRPVLEAWQRVEGYLDWPFYFMVEPTTQMDAMVALIEKFDHPEKTLVLNEQRLGVLSNPHAAMSRAFEDGADFTVLAEEDLEPHPDALAYFEACADAYAQRTDVLAVCGNPPELFFPSNRVQVLKHFSVWLWGTWADRWSELSSTWDHDYTHKGWDWNILDNVLQDRVCAFPAQALVDNIGKWLGTHSDPTNFETDRTTGFNSSKRIAKWSTP